MKKLFKKRWTLYLYYRGILVAKRKIDENEAPAKNSYAVNVYFKKQLFGNNKAGVILKPVRILKNDENKKRTYWGTTFETGIEID